MSELTFEQMLEESLKTIHAGEVVEGTVIDVKPEEVILNIGYKSDGVLTRNEYTNDPSVDMTAVVKPGDKMEVKVLKVNDGEGQVILSYKRLAADRGNKRIEEAYNNHEVLTAKVTQVLDGGLSVVVEEVRIFIPASLVSDTYEKDLNKYAGSNSLSASTILREEDISATASSLSLLRKLKCRRNFWKESMKAMLLKEPLRM